MRKELKILSVLALSLTGQLAFAQIKGKVQESDGLPSIGSKVEIKGTGTFTRTNDEGEFELSTAKVGDVLVITNLDDQKQEVKASDDLVFKFSAPLGSKKETEIDAVVVTGYQAKSSDQISSSIVNVGGGQLDKFGPATSTANMLQGKGSGINVTALNGKPGEGAAITIRQVGNTSGETPPLYVIDGARSNQEVFNRLNPSDIQEISVLKDAASAAIYGADAANGVVIVTTKSGKIGKAKFSFNTKYGFAKKTKDKNFSVMNSQQKIDYEIGLNANAPKLFPNLSWTSTDREEALSNNHNWQDDILRKSSIASYAFDVTGGNNLARYYLSLGYDEDNGIVKYLDGFKRYSGRMKIDMDPSEKLRIGANIGITYTKSDEVRDIFNAQNPFAAMYMYNPYEPVYDKDGEVNPTSQGFPVIEALQRNKAWENNLYLLGSLYGEYEIFNFLKFKTQFGGNYNNYRRSSLMEKGSYLDQVLGYGGNISERNDNTFQYTWTNSLNFNKSYHLHNIDLLALTEYAEKKLDYILASGRNFSSIEKHQLTNASTPASVSGYKQVSYRIFSLGAFLSYDYAKKYIFTASIRQDADSRFGKDETFSDPFWSVSGAWNIAKENFMSTQTFINDLKLRASYGLRGYSNSIPTNVNKLVLSSGGYGNYPVVIPYYIAGNNKLKWEVTKTQNYGVEYSIWKRRIRGSAEYYIDNKKDFVLPVMNSSVEGGSYQSYINAGKMRNQGWELAFSADILRGKDYTWTVYGNISFVKSKIKELHSGLDEIVQSDYNVLKVGYKPNLFYLVRYAGVDAATGDALYYDKNGNVTNVYSSGDAVPIYGKSPNPSSYGGFGTTVNFKGFDITADFTYSIGKYSLNFAKYQGLDPSDANTSNKWVGAENYWTEPGQTNVLPRPTSEGLRLSDYFLEKASYLRFRSLEVGYTFNKEFLGESLGLDNIRVYFQAQNLYTWTDFHGDPEVGYGSSENQTEGFIPGQYYQYSYPTTKTFLFGLQVNF